MKIINRYLAREVYAAMLVVVVILLAIFLSNQFVRYMHYAAIGNLSGQGVRLLILLQLPVLSAILVPVGLFFAILLAYGRLYADSEMTVLIACGVSPWRLLATTFKFSIGVFLFVAFLSFWVNPKIYKYSDRILAGTVLTAGLETMKSNIFTPIANEKWVFYTDDTSADKDMSKVARVFAAEQPSGDDYEDKHHLSVVMAKGVYQKTDPKTGDLYVVLNDGYRYVGTPGKKDYEVTKYDEYLVRIRQDVGKTKTDASSDSTLKLWRERGNKLSAAELQWRIALPLSALILTLIGVPLSRIRPRHGRYAKFIPAILLYIVYVNFLFLARAWMKDGTLSPALGMWWVHGMMLVFATFLMCSQTRLHNLFSNKGKS